MTTNNEAFENLYGETPHEIQSKLNYQEAQSHFNVGWNAATTEANKRMAELQSEVAELKESNSLLVSMNISLAKENSELQVQLQNWKDFSKKIQKIDFNDYLQLQASNNHLREALEFCRFSGEPSVYQKADKALSATPAQSLQAHDDEVLELAANIKVDYVVDKTSDPVRNKINQYINEAVQTAISQYKQAIRSLKEVK